MLYVIIGENKNGRYVLHEKGKLRVFYETAVARGWLKKNRKQPSKYQIVNYQKAKIMLEDPDYEPKPAKHEYGCIETESDKKKKMTDEQVRQFRKEYNEGTKTIRVLAKKYGINTSHATDILNNKKRIDPNYKRSRFYEQRGKIKGYHRQWLEATKEVREALKKERKTRYGCEERKFRISKNRPHRPGDFDNKWNRPDED